MTNKPSVRIDYSARFKRDLKQLYIKYLGAFGVLAV